MCDAAAVMMFKPTDLFLFLPVAENTTHEKEIPSADALTFAGQNHDVGAEKKSERPCDATQR